MEHKFYILVPVYKVEKYIDTCIHSVLAQTYSNFRLILVDDGTPDRSGQICDDYAQKDPRITVIHKQNGGLISARRAAVERMLQEAADEDFAIFLDSDDAIKPNTLQTINDAINQHTCDMVVYGFERVFEGKVLSRSSKAFLGRIDSKRELYRFVFFNSEYNALWRKATSKKLIEKLRENYQTKYDYIRLGEDLMQSIPLYANCTKAVFIPENLYEYTWNPDSITGNRTANKDLLDPTVRRLVLEFLEQQPEWTREDMDHYLRFCRKLVVNRLLHIESIRTGKQEKIRLFGTIKADAYYHKILQTATEKDTYLNLLKQEKYGLLLMYLKAYNLAVAGKQLARRLLAR